MFSGMLNSIATVQSFTQVQNALGEQVDTYANLHTNVPCRVKKRQTNQKGVEVVELIETRYTIYMQASYSMAKNYHIIVDGRTYKVLGDEKDSSNHHWELDCERIDN